VSPVKVDSQTEEPYDSRLSPAITSEIVIVFKGVTDLNPLIRDPISTLYISQLSGNVIDGPSKLADVAAAVLTSKDYAESFRQRPGLEDSSRRLFHRVDCGSYVHTAKLRRSLRISSSIPMTS
jgi:hypothetical protein